MVQTTLAIQNPGNSDDFDATSLGLLPKVQNHPLAVDAIEPGMPAAKVGLKPRDVIASVDGHTFTYVASFVAYLQQTAGRPVDLTVLRDGQTLKFTVKPMLAENGKGTTAIRSALPPHGRPTPWSSLLCPRRCASQQPLISTTPATYLKCCVSFSPIAPRSRT